MRLAAFVVLVTLLGGCASPRVAPVDSPTETWPAAVVSTDFGSITFVLFANETPKTFANFAALVHRDFYENSRFDRVVDDFVIQGGASYNASQAPAPTEPIEPAADLYFSAGSVGIARDTSPDSGSSVFFICEYPEPYLRDPDPVQSPEGFALGRYTVFGQVVDGMSVVRKIASQPTNAPGADDTPKTPIVIHDVRLVNLTVRPGWRELYPLRTYGAALAPPYRVKLESAHVLEARDGAQHLLWYVENAARRGENNSLEAKMVVTGPDGKNADVALAHHPEDPNVFIPSLGFAEPGSYRLSFVETDLPQPRTLATVSVDVVDRSP